MSHNKYTAHRKWLLHCTPREDSIQDKTLPFPSLSGGSVAPVPVQPVLKREDSQTTFDSTTAMLSLHCGSRTAPTGICSIIKLENVKKVNNFKNSAYILGGFIATEIFASLGLTIFLHAASFMGYALWGNGKGCLTLHTETYWPFLCTLHGNVESSLRSMHRFINPPQGF